MIRLITYSHWTAPQAQVLDVEHGDPLVAMNVVAVVEGALCLDPSAPPCSWCEDLFRRLQSRMHVGIQQRFAKEWSQSAGFIGGPRC